MTAQAAPPDADGRVNLSLHYGATARRAHACGQRSRPGVAGRGESAFAAHAQPGARLRQHPAARVDRRPRRSRRRAVRARGSAAVGAGRGHRGTRAGVRHRWQHLADGYRRDSEHDRHQAGRWCRWWLRRALGDAHHRSHAPASGGQGHQRCQGDVRRRVRDDVRAGIGGALPVARRQSRRGVPSCRRRERSDGHRPQPQAGVDQRRAVCRPLRPDRGRQHRRETDLRSRWSRGLRRGRRSSGRRALAHLPPLHGDDRRRGALAHRAGTARGRDRVDPAPSHRGCRDRVRRRAGDRAHGARTSARARRYCPPGFPGRATRRPRRSWVTSSRPISECSPRGQ